MLSKSFKNQHHAIEEREDYTYWLNHGTDFSHSNEIFGGTVSIQNKHDLTIGIPVAVTVAS